MFRAFLAISAAATLGLWAAYFGMGGLEAHPVAFGRLTYLASGAVAIAALFHLGRAIMSRPAYPRSSWAILLLSAVVTALTLAVVRPDYRVLEDETTLTSISYMMAREASATTLFEAVFLDPEPTVLTQSVDKRPTLFPFLVHLIHHAVGYSVANPFALNAALLFALLSLTGLVIASRLGLWAGVAGQLLVAAQPAVFLSATSAGFDLLSSVLLFGTLAAIASAIESPQDARRRSLAAVLLIALAWTRYESSALAVLLACVVFASKEGRKSFRPLLSEAPWLPVAAVAVTPLLWILLRVRDPRFHEVAPGESVLSLAHLGANFGELLRGWFVPPPHYPDQSILWALTILSGVVVAARIPRTIAIRALACAVVASGLLTLSHFFGKYTNPLALRLFLPVVIPAAVLPAVAFGLASLRSSSIARLGPVAVVLAAAAFAHGISARSPSEIFSDAGATRAFRESRDHLATLDPRATIVVSRAPTNFSVLGFSSVDFDTFARNVERLQALRTSGKVKQIVVFQTVSTLNGAIPTGESLPPSVELAKVDQKQISSRNELRISLLK